MGTTIINSINKITPVTTASVTSGPPTGEKSLSNLSFMITLLMIHT